MNPPANPPRACVYTCIIGNYEKLNEQPAVASSSLPFICLTDDPELKSSSWRTVLVDPVFPQDTIRSQRLLKILAHRHLPEFEHSLYLDNSVLLSRKPEDIMAEHFDGGGFVLPNHSTRDSVLDEFLAVSALALDDQSRIFEQLNHYLISDPEVLEERPYWTGLMMRDHRDPQVCAMLEIWASHVLRYSRRDQLSINHALRLGGVVPRRLDIDLFTSSFHSWPHMTERLPRQHSGRDAIVSIMPLTARLRKMEQDGAVSAQHIKDLQMQVEAQTALAAATAGLLAGSAVQAGEMQDVLAGGVQAREKLKAKLGKEKARHQQLRAKLDRRTADRDRMAASLSWKITRPLRKLAGLFQRSNGSEPSPPATAALHLTCANGRRIYFAEDDRRGQELAAKGGNLNPITLKIWMHLMAAGPWTHIVDIGANYGEMLVNVDPPRGVSVFAVEPNPKLLPFLKRTLRESPSPVKVTESAFSDGASEVTLDLNHTWSGMTGIAGIPRLTQGYHIEQITVPATTLDQWIKAEVRGAHPRLLMKIDVEGHEVGVLRGGLQGLQRLESWAVLLEIIHLPDPGLEWLLSRFSLELFDLQTGTFHPVSPPTVGELRQLLASERYYPLDAVLRGRSKAGSPG